MNIWSPVATGNGAFIVHEALSRHVPGYTIHRFSPRLTFMPALLYGIAPEQNVDLVHTTPDYAIFFKRHAPTVITFHNYVLDPYMRAFSSHMQNLHYQTDLKLFTRKIAEDPSVRITAVSKYIADLVESELGITRKIDVIYNGINTDVFYPGKNFEQKSERSRLKILFSGNLTRRKGAQWLDEIAQGVGDFGDVYITSGLRAQKYYLQAPNIIPIGHIPHSQMADLYRSMDVLLFPTVREGFGLSAAEAMACGLPVVCSDCSALVELVPHEKGGFRVPTGNISAYCSALRVLSKSVDVRYDMGTYNYHRIRKHFPQSRMIASYTTVFKETLNPT